MATRSKVPKFNAPALDDLGHMTREWYEAVSRINQVGQIPTTATAGAGTLPAAPSGFITIIVNDEQKLVPFYDP